MYTYVYTTKCEYVVHEDGENNHLLNQQCHYMSFSQNTLTMYISLKRAPFQLQKVRKVLLFNNLIGGATPFLADRARI